MPDLISGETVELLAKMAMPKHVNVRAGWAIETDELAITVYIQHFAGTSIKEHLLMHSPETTAKILDTYFTQLKYDLAGALRETANELEGKRDGERDDADGGDGGDTPDHSDGDTESVCDGGPAE